MKTIRHAKQGLILYTLMLLLIFPFIYGCNLESDSDSEISAGSGGLSFSINWPTSDNSVYNSLLSPAAISSCTDLGISTVEALVFDVINGATIGQGGPWDCEDRQGVIQSIVAGSERKILLYCYGPDDELLFRGEKGDITVIADQTNDAGEVDVTSFVPEKQEPADNATVDKDALSLVWDAVVDAHQYQVIISTQADLSEPLIDQTVFASPFTPTGLAGDIDYFWQIFALDEGGTQGSGSAVRQFTTEAEIIPENNVPVVTISTPTEDDLVFESGTAVVFTATATDQEDGVLDDSLTWESDIDGPIGSIGGTISVTDLTLGPHTITVTATDSNTATATATVRVNIVLTPSDNPPVADISSPTDGAIFNEGDVISFTGTGADEEDGDLAGSSLEWKDASGTSLGFGATLDHAFPVGTHTITLTVRDSNFSETVTEITFTVQGPPLASITLPIDTQFFLLDADQDFQGSASDPEDGSLSGTSLVWSSNVDGVFGTGQTVSLQNGVGAGLLSEGNHTITLTATDSHGSVDSTSINIYVEGIITVNITGYTDGQRVNTDDSTMFPFFGAANDPEEGPLTGTSLEWFVDNVSQGTGDDYTPPVGFAYGTHQIRLEATDSNSNIGQTTITIIANNLPTGGIEEPIPGGYALSTPPSLIFFNLIDDGPIQASDIVWTSDLDGLLGTGTDVPNPVFNTAGDHVITVTITDELGGVATWSVTINLS